MNPAGIHIVAELAGCSPALLDDAAGLEGLITQAVAEAGLGLLKLASHRFAPVGVTVVAIISESHIAIHTYPEMGHASLDLFTCNPASGASQRLLDFFLTALAPQRHAVTTLRRGEI